LLHKAGELGLLSADIPEEYGGLNLDKISSSLITEKFARAGGFSVTHGAHVGIGTLPIVFFGNHEQDRKSTRLNSSHVSISYAVLARDLPSFPTRRSSDLLLHKAGELGLLSADIPEEYGGLNLDKISSSLITEKFARAGGFSVTHGAHVGIGTLPIVFFGNHE